jgi:hypothetical protein
MSDDSGADGGRFSGHVRGIVVTTLACLMGIAAGLVSAFVVGTTPQAAASTTALVVMAAFVVGQFPILQLIGIDIGEFGLKDNLYVSFMTFTLWFISYAVLLTSAVSP